MRLSRRTNALAPDVITTDYQQHHSTSKLLSERRNIFLRTYKQHTCLRHKIT